VVGTRAGVVGAALAVICVAGATATPAAAKTIHVRAKQDDAINKAIDRANPGDRLVVHRGTYKAPVVVDKRVRIVGRKKRHGRKSKKPVINPGCGTDTGFDVRADGVSLRRLKLRGGNLFTLDISLVDSGTARQLRAIDTCDALYGINVFDSGPVELLQNRTSGYLDAGIYVGGISDTGGGTLLIRGNDSFANNRGLIVEDSDDEPGESVVMRVADNRFHDNTIPEPPGEGPPVGIFVNRSHNVTFVDNLVKRNGVYGVHLDPLSTSKRFFDNTFTSNPTPVFDQGTDNCGSGNVPNEFPAC
jgi:nitrous oxidase accessory protein NosD